MTSPTLTTEDFLLAAKRSEISTLRQLMISCDLVTRVTELIHELQRERGQSNIFLISQGSRFVKEREEEMKACLAAEDNFRRILHKLNLDHCASSSSRIFSCIAHVLHGLDGLPGQRELINQGKIRAAENTQVYSDLITGLLSLVFEAADLSSDPDITRALVAMFNFEQGKEYSGLERAWGLIGFTAGEFKDVLKDRLKGLQEAQERCYDIFNNFAHTIAAAQWRQIENSEATGEFQRMRQMINRFQNGDTLPTAISDVWYEVATRRMDSMQDIEKELASYLLSLCEKKIEQAEEDLRLHHEKLKLLEDVNEPPQSPLNALGEGPTGGVTPGANVKLARSIYDLVQDQAQRLERMGTELSEVRQALEERKLIDKAKGILIQSRGITEEEAYKQLRQSAMDSNKRIIDVAINIISVADMLKTGK